MIIITVLDLLDYCDYHNIDTTKFNFPPEKTNYLLQHNLYDMNSIIIKTYSDFVGCPITNLSIHLRISNLNDNHKLLLSDYTWKKINTFRNYY